MRRTLGAPLGGTTRGGHHGFEFWASRPIRPPKGGAGFGRNLPSTVVVAFGAPGVPMICWAGAGMGGREDGGREHCVREDVVVRFHTCSFRLFLMVVSLRSWKMIEVTSFRLSREKLLGVTRRGICAPDGASFFGDCDGKQKVVRNLIELWRSIMLMSPFGRLAIGL